MHDEGDVLHVTTSQSVALGRLDTDTGAVLGGEAAAATLERASQLAAGDEHVAHTACHHSGLEP